jgi:hypothetical protein
VWIPDPTGSHGFHDRLTFAAIAAGLLQLDLPRTTQA